MIQSLKGSDEILIAGHWYTVADKIYQEDLDDGWIGFESFHPDEGKSYIACPITSIQATKEIQ